jgi:hypothetical protein
MTDDFDAPLLSRELRDHRLQLPLGGGSQEFGHDRTMC